MVTYYIERISKLHGGQDIIKMNVKSKHDIPLSTDLYWFRIYTIKELAKYFWDKGYHFYGWEHFKTKYWEQLPSSYKKKIIANLESTYKDRPYNMRMHVLEVGVRF